MAVPLEKIIGGKYEILEKLNEGGIGSIYKVRHRLLEEIRVVKVLQQRFTKDAELKTRFHNEAKTAIRLRHPNIAHVLDYSLDDEGNAFLVMEFIDGVNLQEMLATTGRPSLSLAVEIGCQTLDALGYLHRQGFVHRDIACDNLMLTTDYKGDPLVKLIDLGIAKDPGGAALTATGMFLGKVRYAAPEQFRGGGAAKLDHRSDIYSFGVVFYELLTGSCPIRGRNFSDLVASHLFKPPLSFSTSDPEDRVPKPLREAVLAALEKDPARRTESAEEIAAALQPFRQPPDSSRKEFADALTTTVNVRLPATKTRADTAQGKLDRQFGIDDTTAGSSRRAAAAVNESAAAAVNVSATAGESGRQADEAPQERERGLPPWVWVLLALAAIAAAFVLGRFT